MRDYVNQVFRVPEKFLLWIDSKVDIHTKLKPTRNPTRLFLEGRFLVSLSFVYIRENTQSDPLSGSVCAHHYDLHQLWKSYFKVS